ncbi:MAG TPA: TIR domain-containing protein [Ktedonobacteraceae bacterium]|nr:TIR domain-containing protein [Ktedonobacteraceae bacterium]
MQLRNIIGEIDSKQEMHDLLSTANVILLLVSTDFLHSDFCYEIEMKEAMRRHERGEAYVIPVILRPCDWQEEPFGILKPLPTKGKAVTKWHNRDDAFLDINRGIRKAIEDLPLSSTSQDPSYFSKKTYLSPGGFRDIVGWHRLNYREPIWYNVLRRGRSRDGET